MVATVITATDVRAQLIESIREQIAAGLLLSEAEEMITSSAVLGSLVRFGGPEAAKRLADSVLDAVRRHQAENVLEPLKAIHRHEGYITFHDERFKQVTALRTAELESTFPQFLEPLARDGYYSIHGMRKKWKTAALVSHLTSCFVDLDYHDDPHPRRIEHAISDLWGLVADGVLPAWSMLVRSGRGIWLFWLIRSEDIDRAVPRSLESRALWLRLQRAIGERLSLHGLPVDREATIDLARLTRLPESINSKSETQVKYIPNLGADGRAIGYTMVGLARAVDVPEILPAFADSRSSNGRLHLVKTSDDGESPAELMVPTERTPRGTSKQAKGWRAVHERRRRDFELLLELRGGKFYEGCRNHALVIAGWLARGSAESVVSRFAREYCEPPPTASEIHGAVKLLKRRLQFRDLTIGAWLNITLAENDQLEGDYLSILGGGIGMMSIKRREKRRELISQMCHPGRIPPLRQIVEQLRLLGVACTHRTVRLDLEALGIRNPRAREASRQTNLLR